MKHQRLATALVVTSSVLGLAACSWFGDDSSQASASAPRAVNGSPVSSAPNSSNQATNRAFATPSTTSSGASGASNDYSASTSTASIGSSTSAGSMATSSSEMRSVQQHLQQLGYYKGRVDGIWGKQSRQALAQFQRDKGMQATGQLDDSTMQALNSGSAMSSTGASGISARSSSSMNSPADVGRSSTDSRYNSLNSPKDAPNANNSNTSSEAAGSGNPNAANSTGLQPSR